MIRINVSTDDVVATRFAVNSVWETAASLTCLAKPRKHVLHARLRQCVPVHPDFDLDLLLELTGFMRWIPDVLGPIPSGTAHNPPAQFAGILDTDPEVLENDLRTIRDLLPGSRSAAMGPEQYVEAVATAMTGYWRAVLEPLWERVIGLDEADIAHHHATLAEAGIAVAIHELHDELSYHAGAICVDLPKLDQEITAGGRGIWLVPSVFRWPWLSVNFESPEPIVSYAARGSALVWERPSRERLSLVGLIGRSRASILELLDLPRTTTWLARRLGLAPGTVSGHLSVMAASGLLDARRNGRQVLYSRTHVADLLLDGDSALRRLG